MEVKRTLTMNWDGLGEDDDDSFFESKNRLSTVDPLDLGSSGSDDDDDFQESRISFAPTVSSRNLTIPIVANNVQKAEAAPVAPSHPLPMPDDYGMWMAEPGDVKERRSRLLQGMGLVSNKKLLGKIASAKIFPTAISGKFTDKQVPAPEAKPEPSPPPKEEPKEETPVSIRISLVRSRSDGDIETSSMNTKKRKEELIGPISKQRLTRTSSVIIASRSALLPVVHTAKIAPQKPASASQHGGLLTPQSLFPDSGVGSFFLIKNLDTGKDFIVKEFNEQGLWNKLSDVQTGKQLTMEEFEKSVGYSPIVKELMRRRNVGKSLGEYSRKMSANSYLSKSFRYSKRRGVAILKNIKGVASSVGVLTAEKERENQVTAESIADAKNSSQWVKVRAQGKSYKEFTALHLCQEIQAHEGSIWTMKFSCDAHYLATAGEDKVIHIWEVQQCDVMSAGDHSSGTTERQPLAEVTPMPSEKRKKGKVGDKKKGNSMPDYALLPETVFAISDKPICSFKGHQEDVLDLSWSRRELLLSSSMDKTVRLWDVENQTCLKLFAHNDYGSDHKRILFSIFSELPSDGIISSDKSFLMSSYAVTCIHFNPVDDDHFLSGSLDGKVRIWNVPDRHVVDWTDFHEMVTAACYTPDGQGAVIGSHKGSCRTYTIVDEKLEQKDLIEFQNKKSQAKKVSGLQFSPWNPGEMLVTCADSRIRILEGTEVVQRYKGFKNTSSQIAASFTADGKYIVCASEDNNICIWKKEDHAGKSKATVATQSYEQFPCKEVVAAIPWPGSARNETPVVELQPKKNTKRSPQQSAGGSPTKEDKANGKKHLPPLPRKNDKQMEKISSGNAMDEDGGSRSPQTDQGTEPSEPSCESPPSMSASSNGGQLQPSPSSSSLSDGTTGGSGGNNTVQATAWGTVIIAATAGGEIKVFQNFGLPVKAGRQTMLFRDLT